MTSGLRFISAAISGRIGFNSRKRISRCNLGVRIGCFVAIELAGHGVESSTPQTSRELLGRKNYESGLVPEEGRLGAEEGT